MAHIECDLLTGFLGSGKTTLLNAFLNSPQAKGAAVIVNEIGDIGIDQLVLAEVADNMLLLESGCLCCTLTGTLRETVLNLIETSRSQGNQLKRIVIETTGLAEPLPLLHSLLGDKALTDVIKLNQVIVTVDAMQAPKQVKQYPECVRQIAAADTVVITKIDQVNTSALQRVHDMLARINTSASRTEAMSGKGSVEIFTRRSHTDHSTSLTEKQLNDSPIQDEIDQGQLASFHNWRQLTEAAAMVPFPDKAGSYLGRKPAYHHRIRTESFYLDMPIFWPGIAAWWHLLVLRYGQKLLRCKGLFEVQGIPNPYVFIQGVGQYFHPPQYLTRWPDTKDARSRVICIGSGLENSWLQKSLRALQINEAGLLPSTLEELNSVFPERT